MQEYTVTEKIISICGEDEKITEWRQNGLLHREHGPALEFSSGTQQYFKHGEVHREDGPAMECTNGNKAWYIHGHQLSETEFNNQKNPCNGKIVEIDGKKYKLEAL